MEDNWIKLEQPDDALLDISEYSSEFVSKDVARYCNGERTHIVEMSCSKPYQKGNYCSAIETLPSAKEAVEKLSSDEPYKAFLMEGSPEVKQKIRDLVIDNEVTDLVLTYDLSIFQEPEDQDKLFADVLEFVKNASSTVKSEDAVEIAEFLKEQINKLSSQMNSKKITILPRSRIAFSDEMKSDINWHIDGGGVEARAFKTLQSLMPDEFAATLDDSEPLTREDFISDDKDYLTEEESQMIKDHQLKIDENIEKSSKFFNEVIKMSLKSTESPLNKNIVAVLNFKGASTEFYDYDKDLREEQIESFLSGNSEYFKPTARGQNNEIFIDSDKIIAGDKERGFVSISSPIKFGAVHSSPHDISESRMIFIIANPNNIS